MAHMGQEATENKGARVFVRRLAVAACFVPALLFLSLLLRGETFSLLCAGMLAVPLCTICLYAAKQQSKRGAAALFASRAYTWICAAGALLVSGVLFLRFIKQYFAAIYGLGRRDAAIAALFNQIPLPQMVKLGLLSLALFLLFALCVLGVYVILINAYRRQEDGTEPDPFVKKLLGILPIVFCLFFTLTFFGPLDIIFQNAAYLDLHGGVIWLPLLGCMLALTLLLSVCIALMERGMYDLLRCLLFGFALMAYLQGTFFNTDLGRLDGSAVDWSAYAVPAIVGCVLWTIAILAQIPARRILREKYGKITGFVALAIVAMQLAALVVVATQSMVKSDYTLDGKDEFMLSADENVVVFTLDYLDNTLFDEILEQYPETAEEFKDFVYYENTSSMYSLTFPSLIFLLTGMEYDTTVPTLQYIENAWKGETAARFYETLKARGYTCNLYARANYAAVDVSNMLGTIDNVVAVKMHASLKMLLETMRLSLYRYAPLCAKEMFWTTTDRLDELTYLAKEDIVPTVTDHRFIHRLRSEGLTLSPANNRFVWYHLDGAHEPFVVDEEGYHSEQLTDRVRQTRGYLLAVSEYLEQMKALGIYDQATVILSADHGYENERQIALLIKRPHQTQSELETSHAPAAQEDVMPTILDCMGEDYGAYGLSVFDLTESMERERVIRLNGIRSEYPPTRWIGDFNQWDMTAGNPKPRYNVLLEIRYTGDRAVLTNRILNENFDALIPLYDSFY